jgi:hypothetical protein
MFAEDLRLRATHRDTSRERSAGSNAGVGTFRLRWAIAVGRGHSHKSSESTRCHTGCHGHEHSQDAGGAPRRAGAGRRSYRYPPAPCRWDSRQASRPTTEVDVRREHGRCSCIRAQGKATNQCGHPETNGPGTEEAVDGEEGASKIFHFLVLVMTKCLAWSPAALTSRKPVFEVTHHMEGFGSLISFLSTVPSGAKI